MLPDLVKDTHDDPALVVVAPFGLELAIPDAPCDLAVKGHYGLYSVRATIEVDSGENSLGLVVHPATGHFRNRVVMMRGLVRVRLVPGLVLLGRFRADGESLRSVSRDCHKKKPRLRSCHSRFPTSIGLTIDGKRRAFHLDGDAFIAHLSLDTGRTNGRPDVLPIDDPEGRRIDARTFIDPHVPLDVGRRSAVLVVRVLVQDQHRPYLVHTLADEPRL